jgi:hypothetical protein
MDLTLSKGYWIKFCMKMTAVIPMLITAVSFTTLLVNCYSIRLLPLIRQVFLIPNRINELMDLRL